MIDRLGLGRAAVEQQFPCAWSSTSWREIGTTT